jgi:hypothetical protein
MAATDFEIHYSDDDTELVEWDMVEIKGWLGGVHVVSGRISYRLNFCDTTSNAQDVGRAIESQGFSFDPDVVVLGRVTKASVEAAISAFASRDFRDLSRGSLAD